MLFFTGIIAACKSAGGASAQAPEAAADTSLVNASVVVSHCPDAPRMNSALAQDAIRKLVEPCAMVPGGKAHFSATLLPGGFIELASPEGNPKEGVVPTCALQHQLKHRVKLRSACKLDVMLEERKVKASAKEPQG